MVSKPQKIKRLPSTIRGACRVPATGARALLPVAAFPSLLGRIDRADILAFGRIVDEADSGEKFDHGGTRCEPALQAGAESLAGA